MGLLNFKLGLDIRAFNAGINKARASFNGWSKDAMKGIGGQIAGAMALESIVRNVGNLYADAAKIQRESMALGISTDEYQALGRQARLAGVEIQDLVDAMNDLNVRQHDALAGSKDFIEIFKRYGVEFGTELPSFIREPKELFMEFARGMSQSGLSQGQILRDLDETMSDTGKRLAFGVMQGFFNNLDLNNVRYKGDQLEMYADAYREFEQNKENIQDTAALVLYKTNEALGTLFGSMYAGTMGIADDQRNVKLERILREKQGEQTKVLKSIERNTKPLAQ